MPTLKKRIFLVRLWLLSLILSLCMLCSYVCVLAFARVIARHVFLSWSTPCWIVQLHHVGGHDNDDAGAGDWQDQHIHSFGTSLAPLTCKTNRMLSVILCKQVWKQAPPSLPPLNKVVNSDHDFLPMEPMEPMWMPDLPRIHGPIKATPSFDAGGLRVKVWGPIGKQLGCWVVYQILLIGCCAWLWLFIVFLFFLINLCFGLHLCLLLDVTCICLFLLF